MKEHRFNEHGPRRCRSCKGRVSAFTSKCLLCGVEWTPSRHGLGLARYEPEPTTPAPAVALAFPDYDDEPIGGAA